MPSPRPRASLTPTRRRARVFCLAAATTTALSLCLTGPTPASASEPSIDHVVSADPQNWTPNVNDGRVDALVQVGNRIIAVGTFTSVTSSTGTTYQRNSIFAFNATTGAIDTGFVPNVGTKEVLDIADAGDGTVFIGGLIANVNGTKASKVARINATTGALITTFKASTINGAVNDLQLSNGKLYIGGSFTTVGGQPRTLLAALNPTTGTDTGTAAFTFADTWNGGAIGIKHFDISDDGATLVAVGNFRSVNAQTRDQIMMADLTGPNATLRGWSTDRFTTTCMRTDQTYLRDVDIDPTGHYFVVAATGAYSGGVYSGTLCDSISRWELGPTGSAQDPTWVDYSGGDTFTQVKATGAAIYAGGHFQWLNNPFSDESPGPGAVTRTALAAVDPRNGMPLRWNPTRPRGKGVWDFMTANAGLWVGHDTNQTGKETRKRLALFPSVGGTTLPAENTGHLSDGVYLLGRPTPVTSAHWVARVNAAGPPLLATDNGPDWTGDTGGHPSPLHNDPSIDSDWLQEPFTRSANLPAGTPTAIFSTERWTIAPSLDWDIPAPVGHHLTVRLHFSNGCWCTELPRQRIFDVSLDNTLVLDNYDVVADVGDQVGTMKEYHITSDGNVDIDLSEVFERPIISGVEIIDDDVPAPTPAPDNRVVRRDLASGAVTGSHDLATSGQLWSNARGAFMIDGTLYTGWTDGTLKARSFDGSSFGPATNVDLNGSADFSSELPHVTAMFYDRTTARLYYTLAGRPQLYYRYFEPESQIIGAVRFDAATGANGVDWSKTSGLILDGDTLYVGSSATGALAAIGWDAAGGSTVGVATVVSGPSVDGYDWRARAMFVHAD